ncbi:peptide deformylase [Candidatus Izimaplasma bacterium ZiA1]|uniref:peptide deformylase n=1 Tax=Candidatus Izimoplasma sp. ZiA1 TaxID=2024899 RepID=UPI000BAA3E91|nr:peptide deformylase [Candidatus Izimaplasma bacterium ZiA1]
MITMKNIIREGHPTLKKKALDVSIPLSDEDKLLLKEMMEFLENSQDPELSEKYNLRPGVGLAAPQINISKRMLVIKTMDEHNERLYKLALINPKITRSSVKMTYLPGGEGCLSVDRETEGLVIRNKFITVKGYNYDVDYNQVSEIEIKLDGYMSIVFQHEFDHLNGVLFVDKLTNNTEDAEPVRFFDEIDNENN